MPLNITLPTSVELKPRIVVIGVGGAGGNAVNNMIASGLDGVEFIVANTDAQSLSMSSATKRVQMGTGTTQGLGAGMRPELGERAAEESLAEILEHLDGAHMLFVAAGMGGGTGTGAAPVIAQAAREKGILTVAIVTKPFEFEGAKRMKLAEEGIEKLYSRVDTLITIPNQNLFRVATDQTTMSSAFALADEVLHSGVKGVTDLMVVPGLINLDFNDVRTVMDEMGKAMMGTGEATGERRAVEAAESAINNPLLDDVSLKGAKGVLINITGGQDLTLYEVHEAATLIRSQVDEDANIIVGSALDPDLDGIIRVSVVATGVEADAQKAFLHSQMGMMGHQASEDVTTTGQAETVGFDNLQFTSKPLSDLPPPMPAAESVEAQMEVQTKVSSEAQLEVAKEVDMDATPFDLPPLTESKKSIPAVTASMPSENSIAPKPKTAQQLESSETGLGKVIKRPIGDFFRKKKSVPISQNYQKPASKPDNTGDLFGANQDQELAIPAFLAKGNR